MTFFCGLSFEAPQAGVGCGFVTDVAVILFFSAFYSSIKVCCLLPHVFSVANFIEMYFLTHGNANRSLSERFPPCATPPLLHAPKGRGANGCLFPPFFVSCCVRTEGGMLARG